MRVVKTYENFIIKETSNEFDLEFAMTKIKEFYSESDVKKMVENEIPNWIDDSILSLENDYKSKQEWYKKNNSGEAQEIISEQIIDWFEVKFGKDLSDEDRSLLNKFLVYNYDSLKH